MQGFTAFLIYISIFVKQKGIAMKTTAEIIEILRDYKARSTEKYGIETLGLFGSVARGEQNEKSDIDVFIKLRKTSYYTLMDIKDDLEQVFRQKVDLITLHETMRALFRRKIEHEEESVSTKGLKAGGKASDVKEKNIPQNVFKLILRDVFV